MQTEHFLCLLHTQIWSGTHVEGRGHTFTQALPLSPMLAPKQRACTAAQTHGCHSHNSEKHFSLSHLWSSWDLLLLEELEGVCEGRTKEEWDVSDIETHGICLLAQYFCYFFFQRKAGRVFLKLFNSMMLSNFHSKAVSRCVSYCLVNIWHFFYVCLLFFKVI